MKGRPLLWEAARLAGIVLVIQLGILCAVALVCRLAGLWTAGQVGQGLVWAGFLAIGLGLLGIKGHWESTRAFGYQYSTSVLETSSWQRARQIVREGLQIHRFMIVMLLVGCVSILLGWGLGGF
jgi:hypothetical protein